jgi:hypothetical protein
MRDVGARVCRRRRQHAAFIELLFLFKVENDQKKKLSKIPTISKPFSLSLSLSLASFDCPENLINLISRLRVLSFLHLLPVLL